MGLSPTDAVFLRDAPVAIGALFVLATAFGSMALILRLITRSLTDVMRNNSEGLAGVIQNNTEALTSIRVLVATHDAGVLARHNDVCSRIDALRVEQVVVREKVDELHQNLVAHQTKRETHTPARRGEVGGGC